MRDQVNKLEKILHYLRQQQEGEFDQDEYIDVRTEVLTQFDNPPIAPRTINDIAIDRKREIRDQVNSLDEELQFLTEYESLLESDLNDIKNQQYDINVELNGPTEKAEEIVENLEEEEQQPFITAKIGGLEVNIDAPQQEEVEEPVGEPQVQIEIQPEEEEEDEEPQVEEVEEDPQQGGLLLNANIGGVQLQANLGGDQGKVHYRDTRIRGGP